MDRNRFLISNQCNVAKVRRAPTTVLRLQVFDGSDYATINVLTDDYVSVATQRRKIERQKYRWQDLEYFGSAPLRIIEERLEPSLHLRELVGLSFEVQLLKAA